jgi:hypothetical protein
VGKERSGSFVPEFYGRAFQKLAACVFLSLKKDMILSFAVFVRQVFAFFAFSEISTG